MTRWTLLLALAGVASCPSGPTDASLPVRGEVVADGAVVGACTLELHTAKDDKLRRTQRVSRTFDTSFVVAPGKDRYYAQVSCEGLIGKQKSAVVEVGGPEKVAIDFGRIVLPASSKATP
jgi:hypothetical protein